MRSSKNEKKAEKEREIFARFADAVGWKLENKSILSCDPPAPDLTAKIAGETVAFELLSATTAEFRQEVQNGQIIYPNNLPIDQKLRRKLLTAYQSSFPIELLIYWSLAIEPDNHILLTTQDVLWSEESRSFRRVWYFGEKGNVFLWYNNWWSEINIRP